ncbi:hypothetical protein HanIR_Chr06g0293541 [Helianthus annuus]|nr:hypothetical protein HanIR_Chr06g0293541 [Helianthus annuus]
MAGVTGIWDGITIPAGDGEFADDADMLGSFVVMDSSWFSLASLYIIFICK